MRRVLLSIFCVAILGFGLLPDAAQAADKKIVVKASDIIKSLKIIGEPGKRLTAISVNSAAPTTIKVSLTVLSDARSDFNSEMDDNDVVAKATLIDQEHHEIPALAITWRDVFPARNYKDHHEKSTEQQLTVNSPGIYSVRAEGMKVDLGRSWPFFWTCRTNLNIWIGADHVVVDLPIEKADTWTFDIK